MSTVQECNSLLHLWVLHIAGKKKSITLSEYKFTYMLGDDLVTLILFNRNKMECEVVVTEKDGNKKKTSVAFAQLPKSLKKTLGELK